MPKYSGIVEGFYWKPEDIILGQHSEFDHLKRIKLLEFMHKKKLNFYLYDPKILREGKHEIYERAYNQSLIGDIEKWQETFSIADKNNVQFYWGIAPGTYDQWSTYHPGWKNKKNGIFNVVERLLHLGAHGIALLFDDVPGGETTFEMQRQAELANILNDKYDGIVAALCPSKYCGGKEELENYLKIFDDNMEKDISIILTGKKAWNTQIDIENIPQFKMREVIIWDNWMASDSSDPARLEFHPPKGRNQNLFKNIKGYILNPCFPVERIIPMVSCIGEIIFNKIEISIEKNAILPNGDNISWFEYSDDIKNLTDIMGQDWAEFLDVDTVVMQKLLRKKILEEDTNISSKERDSVIKKWPSLKYFF